MMRLAAVVVLLSIGAAGLAGRQSQATPGTGFILGRVVDATTGAPVSGVVVTAGGHPQSMLTDAQGRFVFRNLPKGTYSLTATIGGRGFSPSGFLVTGMGHQIGAYLDGSYGQRRPGGPSQSIDLADGERIADAVIRLWKGGAISGRVLDEAGEPLVDVEVAAVERAPDGRLLTGPTARTDDRGLYRIGTLKPGSYLVVVPQTQFLMPNSTIETLLANPIDPVTSQRFTAAGAAWVPPQTPMVRVGSSGMAPAPQGRVTNTFPPIRRADSLYAYQTMFHPSALTPARAAAIPIRSGEERSEVDVQLQPARTVEVSGTLVDNSGPVANFGVHLMPADSGDGASVLEVANTVTDGSGSFVFPLVPSGSYTLLAVRTGPAPGAAPGALPGSVSAMPGAWASLPLDVGDAKISNVVLTLRPGLRITGKVEFAGVAERPPADRLRQLPLVMTRTQSLFRSSATSTTPIDAAVPFTARALPGRYIVAARDLSPAWTFQAVTIAGRDMTDAPFALDADVTDVVIVFTDQPAELAGTVANARNEADADASVFVFPTDHARWPDARLSTRAFRTVRASKTGAFKLPNMIPGEYFAVAAPDDGAGDWLDVRMLARLAALATTIRVDPNQKQTTSLRTVTLR